MTCCFGQISKKDKNIEYKKPQWPIIDAHIHAVNFLQETDGIGGGEKSLLTHMDLAGVDKSVIFGLSVRKKWESFEELPPSYYLSDNAKCYYFASTDEILAEEYLKLSENEQQRIAPNICGFNPNDKYSARYIEKLLDKYPFWKGIGEVLLRHDDLTNLTLGETPRANHPAMFMIYELCVKRDLPIIIHQNSTSVWNSEEYEYLHELKEALVKFPDLKLIWAHCGISRRVTHQNYTKMLDGMMSEHPNLHADISWVVYENLICDKAHQPKKRWIALFEKYADRFFIGSDLCGSYENLKPVVSKYAPLLEALSPETAEKIAFKNAAKMWF